MKKITLVMAFLFASSSFINASIINSENNMETSPLKLHEYRIQVDCDGDGIADYDMSGNFTDENAQVMADQMVVSC